jgi:hypothetical protein
VPDNGHLGHGGTEFSLQVRLADLRQRHVQRGSVDMGGGRTGQSLPCTGGAGVWEWGEGLVRIRRN